MKENNTLDFVKNMTENGVIFSFKGTISQDIIVNIGDTIKTELGLFVSEKTVMKVFAIFIELSQNILHYSAERAIVVDDISIGVGSITLMQDDAMYKISSCNLVNNDDAEEIKKRCDYIKTLDKEGLKNFYLERRKTQQNPNGKSKGAGIGFIDIARKSDKQLEYEIQPLDDKQSYFILSAYIIKQAI